MQVLYDLPALNAVLNGTCAVLLLTGRSLIKRGKIVAHKWVMLSAVATSILFLCSYLYFHAHAGIIYFKGQGWTRPVYFTILITHTILAIVIVPLVLTTLYRGLKRRDERHRVIARWTYPIWMYVSVTGVVVYFMLFRWFRA